MRQSLQCRSPGKRSKRDQHYSSKQSSWRCISGDARGDDPLKIFFGTRVSVLVLSNTFMSRQVNIIWRGIIVTVIPIRFWWGWLAHVLHFLAKQVNLESARFLFPLFFLELVFCWIYGGCIAYAPIFTRAGYLKVGGGAESAHLTGSLLKFGVQIRIKGNRIQGGSVPILKSGIGLDKLGSPFVEFGTNLVDREPTGAGLILV